MAAVVSFRLNKLSHVMQYPKKFSLNFSSLLFVIRVNLLHPQPSLFFYGLLLSLWRFSILAIYYFKVSFNFRVMLFAAKITHNTATEVL